MRYSDLISYDPIESVIQLKHADDAAIAVERVQSYVVSDGMAEQIRSNLLSQLSLDDVVDNKGVFLVGNYGTGKTHLLSVISAIALDASNLAHLRNQKFAEDAKSIAGRFEILRIELGAVHTPIREVIFSEVQKDFKARGLTFDYPDVGSITNNKEALRQMMQLFASKYPDKGYLIVVDELLDFLRAKKENAILLDLGFLRELGELAKESRLRVILSIQEKLFDNPAFSFVSQSINRVRDRYEQMVIRKEDTAYVVSERILKKTDEQKAIIREHLQKFCSMYSNMSERMEEYVNLFPIHPAFIDVFNKVYITENRQVLANISKIIGGIMDEDVPTDAPGILSFDSYWPFIKGNPSYRTDPNIKEVVDKSGQLEDIINRSFPKKLYMPLAIKIIYALSVHRLTTGDIQLRVGLTSENLRDDLCLYLPDLPDQSSDTLQSLVQTVLKDIMTTVSGQFIDYDVDNGQYYLDLKKDIDYDEKITQRAATLSEDSLNNYFFDVIYFCLEWEEKEYVPNFKIYQHTLNWDSHHIFRRGYLFMGTPKTRPTAQPPEDYYIYIVPPYGNTEYTDEGKADEALFLFQPNEEFKNNLKLYAAANILRDLAEEKNKSAYQGKADAFRKRLTKFLSDNKNTCFQVSYGGVSKQPLEVMKGRYRADNPFKETIDLVASLLFEPWFAEKYPNFPIFKTTITLNNQSDAIRKAYDYFAGRQEQLGQAMLDSFGLLQAGKISIQNSKYAQFYANRLARLPAGGVLNFNDIYQEEYSTFLDKEFYIGYELLPIVLLGLVYAGHAVITLKNGVALSASNLEELPKLYTTDICEFKHISRPKELRLGELVRLFEIMELPEGLIRNQQSREIGLEKLLAAAKELVNAAVTAKAKLDGDFSLWGEPLIPEHIAEKYKDSAKHVAEMLGNFPNRFNTVAKLHNFSYSMDQIEKLEADIAAIKTVLEYGEFQREATSNVSYMMNVEASDSLKEQVEVAKGVFRKIRDDMADGKYGKTAAMEVNEELSMVKNAYIARYFEEHKKRRLDAKGSKHKGELISSAKYAGLQRLSEIDILPQAKFEAIGADLAALLVCTELTPEMLKTSHLCPKCHFQLGGNDPLAKGAVEAIEDRLDALTNEWTRTLLNTISDPLVLTQKSFLAAEQQERIDAFLAVKALPEKVDNFFVTAISTLLQGFDAVTLQGADLIDRLTALGPCDAETFRAEIDKVIATLAKGKDKSRLRIIVRE